jgi:protein involved in sex pheromone biosynthesis|tara:strand:+ start:177 stop:440 length:264 start_codon:yes stop_codon:yes gene_type:complete
MTVSVTAKGQDTFEVMVTTQSTTTHLVTVSDAIHTKLTNKKISKKILLEKSFEFLLARELNTSILSQFKIEVVSQYFPNYVGAVGKW